MARRRSANRRSLRKSLNATELDQDSDLFDTMNPMWWKNMAGDMTMRPSLPISTAETTGSILDPDSFIAPTDLQDKWWDNLDRTKLSSSRRFSSRKSLNLGDTYQESFNSDGIDDMSIKKRKVMLWPRANKSGGTDNFQRVLNESDATAQSEPLPGKRKSKSPMRSDTEIARKKTRTRRSHATEVSRDDRYNESLTSNDSDVIVKPRPKAFKKRFTSKLRTSAFGNVLQTDQAGPSGINTSKNVSRMTDSPLRKTSANVTPGIDSNESGLMGPPKSGSLRKRLSSISRKLNLTSDESGSDGASKKRRAGFAKKARKNLSINPFDEILSGHVEEENSKINSQTNTSVGIGKIPAKSRPSQGAVGTGSLTVNNDQTSTMEVVPMNESTSKTQLPELLHSHKNSTVDLATLSGEENSIANKPRSIPAINEISSVSNAHVYSKGRNTLSTQSVSVEDSRNGLMQEWESSDSANEALNDQPSVSISNISKRSTSTKKSFLVSKTLLSSSRTSINHRVNESVESDDEEEMGPDKRPSLKSASHSRMIADSAYELPDKERSDSPIISLSENEDNKSVDDSKRNQNEKLRTRQSADRSIRRDPSQSNVSRKTILPSNTSTPKIDSDVSISEEETFSGRAKTKGGEEKSQSKEDAQKKISESIHFSAKRKINTSRKSPSRGSVARQHMEFEEDNDDDGERSNSKLANVSVKQKTTTPGRNITRGNVSGRLPESDESEDEVKDSQKPKPLTVKEADDSTRLSKNSSMTQNTTRTQGSEKTDRRSTTRDSRLDKRANISRKSFTRASTSQQQILFDNIISEEETEEGAKNNSKSASFSIKEKSDTARKSTSYGNTPGKIFVPKEITNDDVADDAKRSTSKSTKRSLAADPSSLREGDASDRSISEEEDRLEYAEKSNSKSTRSSLRAEGRNTNAARNSFSPVDISGQGSSESDDAVDAAKSANRTAKRKASEARNSSSNVSARRRESEESLSEEDVSGEDKTNLKPANLSTKRKASTARKSNYHRHVSGRDVASEESSGEEDAQRNISKSLNLSAKGKLTTNQEHEEVKDSRKTKSINTSTRLRTNSLITRGTTDAKKSTLSTEENFEDEDSTIDSEAIAPTQTPTKRQNNQSVSVLGKSNVSRTQKNITDFFQSKFSQRSDNSRTLDLTSFDHEKLKLVRQEMEKIKQQEIKAMRIDVTTKKKETRHPDNALKAKQLRSKENNLPRVPAKPAKVVDKAFIVNGTVYKRPKLPRPKAWVTDRLYRYLWNKMQPKFDLSTRIKSERFVVQLAEVVAVTTRRKKYDSYKLELEALMKEMAKLGIIKTRNDFYDFCYDFMPYDFRVKATPILMPGNVRNIPYNPEKLHTPILAEASRSG